MCQQQNSWKALRGAEMFLTPRSKETKQLKFHLSCPSLVLPHKSLCALSHEAMAESWRPLKV